MAIEETSRLRNLLRQLLFEDITDILRQVAFCTSLLPGELLQLELSEPVEAIYQGLDLLDGILLNFGIRFGFIFLITQIFHLKVAITMRTLLLRHYWCARSYLDDYWRFRLHRQELKLWVWLRL